MPFSSQKANVMGRGHSNFLTCLDLKPKSICIRLAVCQCGPGFQAPPVLGKLNWQFSILLRSEGQAADSRKNKKTQIKTHRPDKQEMRQRAMTSVRQTAGSFRWNLQRLSDLASNFPRGRWEGTHSVCSCCCC